MKLLVKLLILSFFILSSCSKYEKLLKSPDVALKYQKAFEYYNSGDYIKSSTLFEQIIHAYRGSSKGDSVGFFRAMSYYKLGDYIVSGEYFKEFYETYNRSSFAEEAQYLHAYCYYLMSPRPNLDQESTKASIESFQLFIYKNPQSKYLPECKRLIAEMQDKIVDKAYKNAKLYFNLAEADMRYYKASMIALRNCINQYPDSKYREELMFLILQANYKYAENSIESKQRERYQATIDEYYSYKGEFQQGQYNKDADKIFEKSKEFLGM